MILPRDILKLAVKHPGHKKKIIALLVDEGYPLDMLKVAMLTLATKYSVKKTGSLSQLQSRISEYLEKRRQEDEQGDEQEGDEDYDERTAEDNTNFPEYETKFKNWNGALYGKFVKEHRTKSQEEQWEIWGDSWNSRSKKLTKKGREMWEKWQKNTLIDQVGKTKQVSSNREAENLKRELLGQPPLPGRAKGKQKSNQVETPLPGQSTEKKKTKKKKPPAEPAPQKQESPAASPAQEDAVDNDFSAIYDSVSGDYV